ncbi:MAG: hypothetical protein RBR42_13305 [Desulfomicrobium sp.]|nr:hypothetical protein [Desulfomicrobium sp.]
MKRLLLVSTLVPTLLLGAGFALAVEQNATQPRAMTQTQEQVYGSQLMTQQERTEYHAKMRAAQTTADKEQLRMEHHESMTERAKARGVTLPDDTPAVRGGAKGQGVGNMEAGKGTMKERGKGTMERGKGNMETGKGEMMERGSGMMERSRGEMGPSGGKMRSGGGRGR